MRMQVVRGYDLARGGLNKDVVSFTECVRLRPQCFSRQCWVQRAVSIPRFIDWAYQIIWGCQMIRSAISCCLRIVGDPTSLAKAIELEGCNCEQVTSYSQTMLREWTVTFQTSFIPYVCMYVCKSVCLIIWTVRKCISWKVRRRL